MRAPLRTAACRPLFHRCGPARWLVDFVVACVAVTAVLLVAYRYAVRYTFVGRLLSGRRTRAADQASRAALAAT